MHLPKYVSLHNKSFKDSWLELLEPLEELFTKRKEFLQGVIYRHPRGREELLIGRKRDYSFFHRSIVSHVNICIDTLFYYYKIYLHVWRISSNIFQDRVKLRRCYERRKSNANNKKAVKLDTA